MSVRKSQRLCQAFWLERPVFEISALNREGCEDLVMAIYKDIEEKRTQEQRSQETQMKEEAQGILSIDPDDPRFKVWDE
jgi:GTP-binding protein